MRPVNELERLAALHELQILDTPPEPHYDAICEIARELFRVPVAIITFLDGERQWFKSRSGTDLDGTSREAAFCRLAILSDDVLVVEDATKDPRCADNPFVRGEPGLRFYAGAPLVVAPGLRLGTLCLLDYEPRAFTAAEQASLKRLAEMVVAHLHLHQANRRLETEFRRRQAREATIEAQATALRRREALLAQTETLANLGTWEVDVASGAVTWSDNLYRIYERPVGEPVTLENALAAFRPEDAARAREAFDALVEQRGLFDLTLPLTTARGRERVVRMIGGVERAEGRPRRAFGIMHDITAHVTAVSQAGEANRFLVMAEQIAQVGHWRVELPDERTSWSDEVYRIYGLKPGEGPLTPAFREAVYHPEDRPRIRGIVSRARETGEDYEFQARIVRPTGEVRTVLVRGIGERDAAGSVRALFGVVMDVTESVRAASDAAEHNRLLLLAEELAHIGHWRIDLETRQITCSDEVLRISGIDPANGPPPIEGLTSLYHPDDREMVDGYARRAIAEGLDYEFQGRIVHPDGTVRTVLTRGLCERDGNGATRAVFGVIMDITDSVRAVAEVEERNRLLLLAEEIGHIGHTHVELPSERVTWSAEVFKIFGLDPADGPPPPHVVRTFYHPEDRARIERYAVDVREGRDFEFEARIIRPDGEMRTVYTRGISETDATGEVRAYFGVVADVTERRRSEERLRASTGLLTATLENMDQGLMMVDAEGRVQIVNRRALELLDLPAEFMARAPLQQEVREYQIAMGEFADAAPSAQIWINAATLQTDHPVYSRRRPNGTVLEIRTAPLPDGGAVRTFTDITERQRRAEELQRAKEAAEEAQARAELANQAKSEFLASMSHEIRTPLNGILGYADLLITQSGLMPEQRRQVERIQSAGSALLTVVDDILDFARIEAGEIRLEPMPFSPRALVGDAVSIIRSVADRKGLTLQVSMDRDLPSMLVGDEARLRQVLLNLLNNAVKFTRQGSVSLDVVRERSGPGADVLTFRVRDTGIGIPPEKQDRLFQRFSQVDGSIRREFGGTGLGLAISKELVERMGGTIGVASRAGEGSTFFFTVALPHAPAEARPAGREQAPARLRPARVLLVEDLDINQELARAVLEAAGHQVDVACDGAEALAAVQSTPYDVVLMDVQMPVMDGITATRQIRALDHPAASLPIVAMTANVLPQQITAYREAGMTDHVGKPFKREELYAALERAMTSGEEPQPAPAASADEPVLDPAILQDLEEMGGPAMVERLLDQFAGNYAGRFVDPAPAQIARDAHALVSSAGMLGLTRLSRACARLEKACLEGGDVEALLAAVRRDADAALAAAAAWRRGRG